MPAYNAEKYIKDSIDSILLQSHKNFEFIIINDGSKDNTKSIIKSYSDARICYIEFSSNKGIVCALNEGLRIARGEYVFRMDADDISLPDRIAEQLAFLESNKNIDVIGSHAIFFDDNIPSNTSVTGSLLNSHKVIKTLLFLCCPYVHPTIVFRNSSKNKLYLLYSDIANYGDDYELFARNIDNLTFGFHDKIVLRYRVHNSENRLTSSNNRFLYKSSTLKTRTNYFNEQLPNFNPKLVVHYEDLFYNDVNISKQALKKTILFYVRFKEAIYSQKLETFEEKYINNRINASFYNSFYQYSKIGLIAFILYFKYSKKLGRFRLKYEIKFFIKCILKK